MNSTGLKIAPLVERLGQALLRMVPRSAEVRVLSGPLLGKKWIAGAGTNGCWLGMYEREKQTVFRALIRPGNVVYDLGANVGFYSLLASHLVGPSGKVFSFEPLPRNLALLEKHIVRNRMSNCTITAAAVSDHSGTACFEAQCNPHKTKLSPTGHITVRLVSLDELVASGEISPPDVIKCDIEGAEFDAIQGARATLSRYRPKILLALHGEAVRQSCCRLLMELGYSVRSLQEHLPLERTDELIALPLRSADHIAA